MARKASAQRRLGEVKTPVIANPERPEVVPVSAYNQAGETVIPLNTVHTVVIETRAAGSSGIKVYGGYFSEEYLVSTLYGTQAADIYDKMRRSDGNVKMLLNAVKSPIKAANWEIHPADPDDPDSVEQAQFIEHVLFRGMNRSFKKFKNEALTLVDFGYSLFEVTHKIVENHPQWGTYVGIKTLGWRSPRSILRWQLNGEDGSIDYVQQLITGDLQRYAQLPGQFLLHMALEQEGDNYEGVSLLRACYGAWLRKQNYLKLMAIGMERNAVPTPTIEVPAGKENSQEYKNLVSMLSNYTSHQNSYLVVPAGWKVSWQLNNFDPEKCKACIDLENTEMTRAFQANFLELGMTSSGSGRALSMDQSQFFLGSIEHIAEEAAEAVNQRLIVDLIDMKYGRQERYPELKITGISDKAGQELAEALSKLATSQWIQPDDPTEANLRKRYGLPKKSDQGVRVVQAPKSMQKGDNVLETDTPEKFEKPAAKASEFGEADFALPKEKKYPIGTITSARKALARAAGRREEPKVRAAIYRKWPALKPHAKRSPKEHAQVARR